MMNAGPDTDIGKLMSKVESQENRRRLARVIVESKRAWTVPIPINQCHRWVQDARNRIVALGREHWDNDDYKIYWVDWNVSHPTWEDHGGLLIEFADGSIAYIDNGILGGADHIAFPQEVENWPVPHQEIRGKLIGVKRDHIGLFEGWSFEATLLGKLVRWIATAPPLFPPVGTFP
jgi:hypothetical protein